jgi:DNA-binding MarR family transcriptional regulator
MNENQTRRFFIPPWLDDLDIKPNPFRVLCHLLRRAGADGRCNPSGGSIATSCHINRDTVWPALEALEKAGLIRRLPKKFGGRNNYLITPPIGGKTGPIEETPIGGKTGVSIGGKTGVPIGGKEGPVSNPFEVIPLKESFSLGDMFKDAGDVTPKNDHDLFTHWNTITELPKVQAISPKRKKNLATRLKDPFFKANWKAAIDKMRTIPFFLGQNDTGWTADIDYFLKPDSVLKIMERRTNANTNATTTKRTVNTGPRTADITEV